MLLLALPAFVAIWSGWVGLGELTGFGPVRPLPGIADNFTLNTAITLPIGMETYASYALYVWLGHRIRTVGTRRYAKWSAFGSLALGAVGQIAYHLMQSAGVRNAPWPVTVLVACLPVAVLGMGAALAHMILREHHHTASTEQTAPTPAEGVARQLHPDRNPAAAAATRTPDSAPPNAPAATAPALGGAPRTTDAPPRRQGVVRPHRRVARTPRHRPPARSIGPRATQADAAIAADHGRSAPAPEPVEVKAEPPLPADRDALIHELTARGMSSRQIAPLVGVAHTTVTRVLDRAKAAPADAPPASRVSGGAPSAPAPVHTAARHAGLQVVHAPQDGSVEVIDAELVEDTEPASIEQRDGRRRVR
ncbi:helix-turn-helix domain-containing protein [Nocardia tenerifensis]|uniref:helix-turn-helix domain-containing protein n=1 Tax=Nocardia tenerifensis TaxID=228006 RepID=UPI001C3F1CC9|nr:helix-turn-helix domain-containing protein [Nocardia tenerifensis]